MKEDGEVKGKEKKSTPTKKRRQPHTQVLWDQELHSEFSENRVRHVL